MATYSRVLLSGSTNGKPVLVNQTTQGTAVTIHTAVAGTTSFDEIYVWCANTTGSAATISILADDGSIVDPDDYYVKALSIPANSPPIPVITGQVLNNTYILKIFASVNNAITFEGYVNRIV